MTKTYKRGFTLIELLVVIAIIGILSSIVLASLNSARKKGRDARRVSDIKQLQLALELYYDACGSYPVAAQFTDTSGTGCSDGGLVGNSYIAAVPNDPTSGLGYAYEAIGSGAICSSYHLGTKLETAGHTVLNSDADYDSVASSQCTGGDWAGNADIAAASGGFNGSADGLIYDVRP